MNLMNTLITRLHWQRIHCYHIFGIMVRYFHQVAKFAPDGGIIIQHISNLNVNALIAALRHEINLLAMGIPPRKQNNHGAKDAENGVFHQLVNFVLHIKAANGVSQAQIFKIVFLTNLKHFQSVNIYPPGGVHKKRCSGPAGN